MIIYAPDADRDVAHLHTWYLERSAGAAAALMARLALAERRILARPLTYRLLSDGETRRHSFRINRTTYLVDYRVEPAQIVVLPIWHGRQNRPE